MAGLLTAVGRNQPAGVVGTLGGPVVTHPMAKAPYGCDNSAAGDLLGQS